jgi:hypothetical protein
MEPSDIPLSETQIKLRRTAAILYKNAQIPQQDYTTGKSKIITGPYGLDPKNIRVTTQEILNSIDCPVWEWNGIIPAPKGLKTPSHKPQYVRIAPKEIDLTPFGDYNRYYSEEIHGGYEEFSANRSLARHKEILAEHSLIKEITKKLGKHPAYLPKINEQLSSQRPSTYIEYYPDTILSGDFEQKIESIVLICEALEEMWRKCGVIFTDIKSENFRQKNHQPVLVDLGSMTKFDGNNRPAIPILLLSTEYSKSFVHPEVINFKEKLIRTEINIESYIAYQIGILLVESFFPQEFIKELNILKNGNHWQDTNPYTGMTEEIVSINDDTLISLYKQYPDRIPIRLAQHLIYLLSNNPTYRPSLKIIKETLTSIALQGNKNPK